MVGELGAMGAGEAFLNVLNDNLWSGRGVRSKPIPESGRDGGAGAGDEGRLVGLKKDGCLRACIIVAVLARCIWMWKAFSRMFSVWLRSRIIVSSF